MMGAVADYERAMTVMRLRDGRRRKAEVGGFAYGSPPLGWTAKESTLMPDIEEQETLQRIHDLRNAGKSLREIARSLTNEGHRPKRSNTWHPETIRRILERGHLPGVSE